MEVFFKPLLVLAAKTKGCNHKIHKPSYFLITKKSHIFNIQKNQSMKLKKISFVLFCAFAIHNYSIAQTDSIVKAKILDDGSQDAEKLYNSGIAAFAAKNFQSALTNFNQAITLKPDFQKAYYNRGTTKFEMKDYTGAISDFDKSLTLAQDPDSYFSRAQTKFALGDKTGALADYSKTIEVKIDYAQAYYYRGELKFGNADYKGALEDFNFAIKYKPDYAYAYNDRGSVKRQLEDIRSE